MPGVIKITRLILANAALAYHNINKTIIQIVEYRNGPSIYYVTFFCFFFFFIFLTFIHSSTTRLRQQTQYWLYLINISNIIHVRYITNIIEYDTGRNWYGNQP